MPGISMQWASSWASPWGSSLALDGLISDNGSLHYRGDMGITASTVLVYDPYGIALPAQSWQSGIKATSVTVTISRAGGVGSLIELEVTDAGNNQIGYVAPTVYPAGQTTVVIALSPSGYDLGAFNLLNTNYPTLGIDVTVLDLFASQGVMQGQRQWTNYLGCGES